MYESIKIMLKTDDKMEVLKYIDEHYEDVLKQDNSSILIPDYTKLKVGKGHSNNNDKVRYGRNRKIDTIIRIREKQELIEQNKADKEETREEKKEIKLLYM